MAWNVEDSWTGSREPRACTPALLSVQIYTAEVMEGSGEEDGREIKGKQRGISISSNTPFSAK